jgi:hypothetical protein
VVVVEAVVQRAGIIHGVVMLVTTMQKQAAEAVVLAKLH